MKKLYYIRHGLTEMNVQGRWAGHIETPLTDVGRAQAKAAGQVAKKHEIDLIVASPLSRALETARIIAKEIGYPADAIVTSKFVIERDFGSLEGKPYDPDLNLDGFSDIETDNTLLERAHLALNWLRNLPEENILVVSHGSFGRALRAAIRKEAKVSQEKLKNADLQHWI
jgi:broad specificity phosphatase PhoE